MVKNGMPRKTAIATMIDACSRLTFMMLCMNERDRKSTRLNSSHMSISYAVFCLKKKKNDRGAVSDGTLVLVDAGPRRRRPGAAPEDRRHLARPALVLDLAGRR